MRDIRNTCRDTGTAFYFKQWGSWAPGKQVPDDHSHYYRDWNQADDKMVMWTTPDADASGEHSIRTLRTISKITRGQLWTGS